jgi:H+/Cl- antiporter ClcA
VGVIYLLTTFLGGGMVLHRFGAASPETMEVFWFVPLVLIGMAAAYFYKASDKLADFALRPTENLPVVRAVIGGIVLGLCGTFFPFTMFSGELQMGVIMEEWENLSWLFLNGFLKLAIISVCISSGWRGGHIFPLMFSGICLGCGIASIVGIDGVFAAAVITAAMLGTVMRKPLLVSLLLLLCFPVTSIIYLCAAAFAGSKLADFLTKRKRQPPALRSHTLRERRVQENREE